MYVLSYTLAPIVSVQVQQRRGMKDYSLTLQSMFTSPNLNVYDSFKFMLKINEQSNHGFKADLPLQLVQIVLQQSKRKEVLTPDLHLAVDEISVGFKYVAEGSNCVCTCTPVVCC